MSRKQGDLRAWIDLLRFHEYGPLFLFSALAGAFLATKNVDFCLVPLLLFITFSSMSAFVLNDLMDAEEDRARGVWRNPIASGRLERGTVSLAFSILALLSLVFLLFLSFKVAVTGLLVLLLSWSYSWGPRFRDRPCLDLIVHGAGPALYVLMGYMLYKPVDFPSLLLAGITFSLSCISCILQQMRDMEVSSKKTTSLIGVRRSVDLAIAFMLMSILLYVAIVFIGALPSLFVIFILAGAILLKPLFALRKGLVKPEQAIEDLRRYGSLLALVMLLAYLLL